MGHPQKHGLHHESFRPGQEEAIEHLMHAARERAVHLVEAPTGSGKTSFAAASSSRYRTMALVRNKSLQASNYEDTYNFAVLYGMANYPCAGTIGEYMGLNADECIFAENMRKCPEHKTCPYFCAREEAMRACKSSLNYSLYLSARWPQETETAPAALYFDEAHLLPSIVLDFVGTEMGDKRRRKFDLAPFPQIDSLVRSNLFVRHPADSSDLALNWLSNSIMRLQLEHERLHKELKRYQEHKTIKRAGQVLRLYFKLFATRVAMQANRADWYIRSGRNVPGKSGPYFVARPLTAKYDAARLFSFNDQRWQSVLMSATIGDSSTLAAELGIESYEFYTIPNQWPKETRPIRVLDTPRLGYKAPPVAWEKQADVITKAIREVNGEWSGVLHTASWRQANDLARRLSRRGLQDRVWVYPRSTAAGGTEIQVKAWQKRKKQVPNSLLISPTTKEGYDGVDERICILAKVPYPSLGDDYEKARLKYDGRNYRWRAAVDACQALGRTRRGNVEDYDLNGNVNGLVAVADGNFARIRSACTKDVIESLVYD